MSPACSFIFGAGCATVSQLRHLRCKSHKSAQPCRWETRSKEQHPKSTRSTWQGWGTEVLLQTTTWLSLPVSVALCLLAGLESWFGAVSSLLCYRRAPYLTSEGKRGPRTTVAALFPSEYVNCTPILVLSENQGFFLAPQVFAYQAPMKKLSEYQPFLTKQDWPRDWNALAVGKICVRDDSWGTSPDVRHILHWNLHKSMHPQKHICIYLPRLLPVILIRSIKYLDRSGKKETGISTNVF